MTLLQRRIARDITFTFLVALTALTLMVMVIGVAREALSQGLGISSVLQMIPFALPNALSLAVPGTALLSVCVVYGRMSADNEFTALQSVGISPLPAMMPAIVITTVLSLATVGLINMAFTWGFHGVQKVVISSVESIAYRVLERELRFQHENLTLSVADVDGRHLISPVINIRRPGQETISITAQVAELSYNDAAEGLTLSITNGSASMGEKASFMFPDTFVHTVPLSKHHNEDVMSANPSHMRMRELPTAMVQQSSDIHRREGEIAVHTAFSILTSRPEELGGTESNSRIASLSSSRRRVHRLDTEMHRRWASGFTCLALALVGIPLAIRLKTSDTMTTFAIVFLPTLLVYYPIFALTLNLAKEGSLVAQGVWIANGIFLLISFVMMRRVIYCPS
ncbi:putative permease YjgP/YjgQ family protein [Rubripirellula amarantea]|uniref:Putative permease YjgP/YjgQ family protein n=1 Tax=Rubripirellula amarantea TaxID=2527999 RepID=A0A5C5WK43_9BACT|nr:LptF/LptG family permease [Rubripirellula amarantea]TWT50222.1 putative permease YjgP/YjgQ family protein [Rubripirellula amarantea]